MNVYMRVSTCMYIHKYVCSMCLFIHVFVCVYVCMYIYSGVKTASHAGHCPINLVNVR